MKTALTNASHASRRRFLARLAGVTGVGAFAWAKWFEPHWLEICHRPLKITELPGPLEGKLLVQISDLHIGYTNEDYLRSALDAVNELGPDILVVTGDVADHHFSDVTSSVERVLSRLKPGRLATIGCLGNHDYGKGWLESDLADDVAAVMHNLGCNVLRNQETSVCGLRVFGIDDFWSSRFNDASILKSASGDFGICLCHNPDVCDEPVWGKFRGTILAGHTHGGQCKPPFFPPPRLPVRNRQYVSGFYEIDSERTLYVNRGVGYGYKARFNCRPEITAFRMLS